MSDSSDLQDLVVDGVAYSTRLTRKYRERKPVVLRNPRRILAYIPGLITEVHVVPGAAVDRGEAILVLEAMKMHNAITSTIAGTVKAVHVRIGQRVAKGDLLVELSE
jgi:biotin carboxyl carrier protein